MFGNVTKNSGECAEFEVIVPWDRYVMLAALSGCQSQVTPACRLT